jgi:bifunctional DNA-binding transcriptional regulator/antitoxin component of YhaV-PrlF toxin-antitoxin module
MAVPKKIRDYLEIKAGARLRLRTQGGHIATTLQAQALLSSEPSSEAEEAVSSTLAQ